MTSDEESTASASRPKTVFISHVGVDQELADEIRRRLTQAGTHVWGREGGIPVGASLREGIEEGIRAADAAVVVLSNAAQAAPWTSMELASLIASGASRGSPRLIPVLAEQGAELPPLLADIMYADASSPEKRDAAVEAVVRAVTEDHPPSRRDPHLLTQELRGERLLLDAQVGAFETDTTMRWERARGILALTLLLSFAVLIIVSAFIGVSVLEVVTPAFIALAGSAMGFYFGARDAKSEESANASHHGH